MEATETRHVILAGIGESRLDLFLLLNEGAGYEVAGVVESEGNGESSRIAEILGVRVFRDHETQTLPKADLLIYGESKYKNLGDQLGLAPDKVWGEEQAWRILTEDGEGGSGAAMEQNGSGGEASDDSTMMISSKDLDLPAGTSAATPEIDPQTDDFDISTLDLPTLAAEGSPRAFGLDEEDATAPKAATSDPSSDTSSHEEDTVSAAFESAPSTPAAEDNAAITDTAEDFDFDAVDATPSDAIPIDESLLKSPQALNVLEAFSTSTKSVAAVYDWTLARAVALTRSYAGGVRPNEPIRLPVWHDRRAAAGGEMPAFLEKGSDEKNLMRISIGADDEPGSAEIVLVGARQPDRAGVKALIRSILPALSTVAELEDLRQEREYDNLTRHLVDSLRESDAAEEAVADTCRELAELFDAREAVLLFENTAGVEYRGFSSKGSPFFTPIGSGLFGSETTSAKPRRYLDEDGEWHYRVPFAHDDHQGVLGLFGVHADAGAVEAVGHRASALANSLARHYPDELFSS